MSDNITKFLPLSPAMLHILMALAAEDRHGYGIMQDVAEQSQGQYKLGPGTLYDNLQKLLDQNLVREAGRRAAEDARRRYYTLTQLGRSVLTAEIKRLETVLRRTKAQLQQPKLRKA